MTPLAAYLLLFLAVGVGFILVHLVAGKLVRPSRANPEKGTVYECGEPTIGSAWVQFDLRFYVVALLFVIFDVEVAFFFPWAEVFGKANAIRAAAEPRSLAEHNAFAARVNDLASPHASVGGSPITPGVLNSTRERDMWRKLEAMTEKEYEAYAELKGDLTRAIRQLGPKRHEEIRGLTDKQQAALKEQAGKLDALIKSVADQQRAVARETLAAIEKLSDADRKALDKALSPPPGKAAVAGKGVVEAAMLESAGLDGLTRLLKERPGQMATSLRNRPVAELSQLQKSEFELVSLTPTQAKEVEKLAPGRAKAINDLASRLAKEFPAAVGAARAALVATGEKQAELWDTLSPRWMVELAKLTPKKYEALQALSPDGLAALETPLAAGVKGRADTLAWLALVEILVFFGVLLVGFAYLWKRGDLAWVRSTAAEEQPAKV